MNIDQRLAALCSAFAHPSRIAILRCLLAHGDTGQTFGGLAADLNVPASTLTHHLREMENAGVLLRQTAGRTAILRLNLAAVDEVIRSLAIMCCPPAQNLAQTKKELGR